ncbi:MFS transporter [Papillibacter cinnamivorans]|nr:MFS transporter [Papillibacter cinnamivorans]
MHRYTAVLLLSWFSQGLLVPVLSLVFMEKGLSLSNLTLGIGVYSAVVVLLEIPTGVAADLLGKRNIFLLSQLTGAAAFLLLLMGSGVLRILAAAGLLGAARALSSGSFEALVIERYRQDGGPDRLPSAIRLLSVSESVGLSAGSLAGGLLPLFSRRFPVFSGAYDLNLLLRLLLSLVLVLLLLLLIPRDLPAGTEKRTPLGAHLRQSTSLLRGSMLLRRILLAGMGIGLVLCVLESYWQPKFLGMLDTPEAETFLLGVLSLLYMASVAGGNLLSEKLVRSSRIGFKSVFIGARLAMLSFVALAAVSLRPLSFALCYCLLYFCFGISNIAEGTMINAAVPDENRATFLSLQSFALQLGAIAAAFGSSLLGVRSVGTLWLLASGMALVLLLPSLKIRLPSAREKTGGAVPPVQEKTSG